MLLTSFLSWPDQSKYFYLSIDDISLITLTMGPAGSVLSLPRTTTTGAGLKGGGGREGVLTEAGGGEGGDETTGDGGGGAVAPDI